MKFFVILEILFVAARVTVIFFPETVPHEVATALTWACVIIGINATAFIGAELYDKINKKRKDKD